MNAHDFLTRLAEIRPTERGCLEWPTASTTLGYGSVRYEGRVWYAHRLSFTLKIGPVPDGMLVCHRCDNRKCCNPEHLYAGSKRDNAVDAFRRGQLGGLRRMRAAWAGHRKTHCKRGHGLTPDNIQASGNHRNCKQCSRERARDWKRARREHLGGSVVEVGAQTT